MKGNMYIACSVACGRRVDVGNHDLFYILSFSFFTTVLTYCTNVILLKLCNGKNKFGFKIMNFLSTKVK